MNYSFPSTTKLLSRFWAIMALILLNGFVSTLSGQTFLNPIRDSAPDPFMVHYNGNYYLTYTMTGTKVVVVKSPNIGSLQSTSATTVWTSSDPNKGQNVWASELHYLNKPDGSSGEKRWYLYYTAGPDPCCGGQRTHVLESSGSDPLGRLFKIGKKIPPKFVVTKP